MSAVIETLAFTEDCETDLAYVVGETINQLVLDVNCETSYSLNCAELRVCLL